MFDILKYPNRRKTITAYIIFGAISLVFVFMGMDTGSNPIGGQAAVVNETIISPKEFEMAYNNISKFYSNLMNGMDFGGQSFLKKMALDQLINQALVKEYAPQIGVYVTESELQDFIINIPAFQEAGRFRKEYYFNYLQSQRLTSYSFERQLSRELAFQKVRQVFDEAIEPSDFELNKEKEVLSSKRKGKFVKWDLESIKANHKASKQELDEWLSKQENVDLVKKSYESEAQKYSIPEQVKASHILLKTGEADPAAKAAIKEKAETLLKSLNAENFADLATKNSEDTASAVKGGDLGYFSKGQMVPEFDDAVFQMKKGAISKVIETDFGYHIIYLEDKKLAGKRPLEEVMQEIAKDKIQETYVQKEETAISEALKSSKELNQWLKKNKVEWQDMGELNAGSESVAGVGRMPMLVDSLFALEKEGDISNLLRQGSSRFLVQLNDIKQDKSSLAMDSIEQQMSQKFSQSLMGDWSKGLEKQAKIVRNENLINQ